MGIVSLGELQTSSPYCGTSCFPAGLGHQWALGGGVLGALGKNSQCLFPAHQPWGGGQWSTALGEVFSPACTPEPGGPILISHREGNVGGMWVRGAMTGPPRRRRGS